MWKNNTPLFPEVIFGKYKWKVRIFFWMKLTFLPKWNFLMVYLRTRQGLVWKQNAWYFPFKNIRLFMFLVGVHETQQTRRCNFVVYFTKLLLRLTDQKYWPNLMSLKLSQLVNRIQLSWESWKTTIPCRKLFWCMPCSHLLLIGFLSIRIYSLLTFV